MKRVLLDFDAQARPLIESLRAGELTDFEREYLDWAAASLERSAGVPESVATMPQSASPHSDILSSREHEVLELLSKALSTKSIARALDLSSGTVKWHLKNIYGKLNALSREDALAKSRALGILN